jgi:hypothetical protein
VTGVMEASASAAFCSIRWLLNLSASGDDVHERRAVRKLVNIGYDGFGEAK